MQKKHLKELNQYRQNLIEHKNEINALICKLAISRLNPHQKSILTQIQNKIREIR